MTEFENAVAQAIAAIPHTDRVCESVTDGVIQCDSCYCDREQRIAQRVAAAIEAACGEYVGSQFARAIGNDAALAALRSEVS